MIIYGESCCDYCFKKFEKVKERHIVSEFRCQHCCINYSCFSQYKTLCRKCLKMLINNHESENHLSVELV